MKKFLSDVLVDCDLTVSGSTSLGTATGITVVTSDNSTNLATTAWVKSQGYITTNTTYDISVPVGTTKIRLTSSSGVNDDITISAAGASTVSRVSDSEIRITSVDSVDYISNVALNGNSLDFNGTGNAFAGSIDLSTITTNFEATDVETVYARVKNVSGGTLLKGTPLAVVTGQTSGIISDVVAADASDPDLMPAVYILNEDIADQAEGEAIIYGKITGIDTSLFDSGDTVYVAPGGGWTTTKPIHPNLIQNLGIITKSHATNGGGEVMGAGRSNDLPNLTPGKIWVGTTNYPIESTTVHIDETNNRVGIGTTTPADVFTIQEDSADFSIRKTNGDLSTRLVQYSSGAAELRMYDATATQTVQIAADTGRVSYINNGQNFGIGTTSPSYKLDVVGDIRALKTSGIASIIAEKDQNFVALNADAISGYINYGHTSNNRVLRIIGNGSEVARFDTSGNLGIGTTSPVSNYKLHVLGSSRTALLDNSGLVSIVKITNSGTGNGAYNGLDFVANNTNSSNINSHGMPLTIATSNTNGVQTTERMRITGDGDVGIGTTAPSYRLDVRGDSLADAVNANIGYNITRVAPPVTSGVTYSLLPGTDLPVGTLYYSITYYNAVGETSRSLVTVTTTTGNQQVQLENLPISPDSSVIGRKIYRSKLTDGSSYGALVATISDNTTTSYLDTLPESDPVFSGHIFSRTIWSKANTSSNFISVDDTRSMVVDNYLTTFGFNSGASITRGGNNTFIGSNSGQNVTYGSGNTLIGQNSGILLTTGNQNIFIGDSPGSTVTTGSYNIALGPQTLKLNGGGEHNIAMGYYTGQSLSSGNRNILLGSYIANGTAVSFSDSVIIGVNASYTTGVNGQVNINNLIFGNKNTQVVGIGTTAPTQKLHVEDGNISVVNGNYYIYNHSTALSASSTSLLTINQGGFGRVGINAGNSGEVLSVTNTARVGIGITTPSEKLHVLGSGKFEVTGTGYGNQALNLYNPDGSTTQVGGVSFRLQSGDFYSQFEAYHKSTGAGQGIAQFGTYDTNSRIVVYSGNSQQQLENSFYKLIVNSNTAAYVTSTGNVGIGTTSPSEKLHVVGNLKVSSIASANQFRVRNSTDTQTHFSASSNGNEGLLQLTNGSNWGLIARGSSNNPHVGAYYLGGLTFRGFGQSTGASHANDRDLMKLDFANERVGIGTTTPQQKLHVDGNIRVGDVNDVIYSNRFTTLSNSNLLITANTGYDTTFTNGGSERMRITNVGKVGIGTTNPLYELSVSGQISSTNNTGSANQRVLVEGDVIQPFNAHGYGDNKPKKYLASHLTDRYFGRSSALYVTKDGTEVSNSYGIFDGSFDTNVNLANAGDPQFVLNINHDTNGLTNSNGFTYPQGVLKIAFYPGRHGTIDGIRSKDRDGVWRTLTVTEDYEYASNTLAYQAVVPSNNYITDFEITITPQAAGGGPVWLASVEYHGYRMGLGEGGLITTNGGRVYNTLEGRNGGTTTWSLGATGSAYFEGNVGISTTNPIDLLHIRKDQDAATQIRVENTSNTSNSRASITVGSAGNAITMARYLSNYTAVSSWANRGGILTDSGLTNGFFFRTSAGAISFQPGSNNDSVVFDTSGNVGIGTTTPSYKLDVAGNASVYDSFVIRQTSNAASVADLYADFTKLLITAGGSTGADHYLALQTQDNYTKYERMRITSTGNVGIGTTSPSMKLDVVGGVKSSVGFQAYITESSDADNIFLNGLKYGIILNSSANLPVPGNSHYANLGNIAITHYDAAAANDFYIKAKSFNGNTSWGKIWTDQNFTPTDYIPTTDYNDFVNVAGDTMTGDLTLSYAYPRINLTDTNHNSDYSIINNDGSFTIWDVTNTSHRFYIKSDGNVGIGTTSPQAKLQINYNNDHTTGDISVNKSALDLYNPLEADTDEKGSIITFSDNYQDANGFKKTTRAAIKGGTDQTGNTAAGFLAFYTDSSSANSATERMRIDDTGNVGIGTTTPGYPLTVLKDLGTGGTITEFRNSNATYSQNLYLSFNSSKDVTWSQGSSSGGTIINTGTRGHSFQVNGTTNVVFNGSGNVGIGTTSPSYKLDVAGDARIDNYLRFSSTGTYIRNSASGALVLAANSGYVTTGWGARLQVPDGSGTVAVNLSGTVDSYINGVNFGIGTTSPSEKLHVAGNVRIDGDLTISGSYTQIDTNVNTTEQWLVTNDGTGPAAIINQIGAQPIIDIQDDGVSAFFIEDGGNVGIGVTDPTAKLDIAAGLGGSETLLMVGNNGNGNIKTRHIEGKLHNSTANGILHLNYYADDDVSIVAGGGNVMIGAGTATQKLEVAGNVKANRLLLNTSNTGYTLYSNGESRINDVVFASGGGVDYVQKSSGTGSFYVRNNLSGYLAYFGSNNSSGQFTNYVKVNGGGNNITIRTNDSDRVHINSSGNVGIGTTNPELKLHVQVDHPYALSLQSDTTTRWRMGVGTAGYYQESFILNSSVSGDVLFFNTSGITIKKEIKVDFSDNSTNLSSGGKALRLANTDTTVNNISAIDFPQSSGGAGFSRIGVIYKDRTSASEDQDMFFRTIGGGSSSEVMRLTSDGNVGIGSTITSGYKLYVNGSTWINGSTNYFDGQTILRTASGVTEVMRVASNGNVGIGTSSPGEKLEVVGGVKISNAYPRVYLADTQGVPRTFSIGTSNETFIISNDTASTNVISIDGSNNNVGIGTTTPSEKLEVSGNVKASNFIADKGAGIYTFSDTVTASTSEDIFSISCSNGAQAFRVAFTCSTSGMSVAKIYEVVHAYGADPVFFKVVDTGAYQGHDFDVSFSDVSSTGLKATITNNSATVNADIVTTVFLGGSPTDITVTAL